MLSHANINNFAFSVVIYVGCVHSRHNTCISKIQHTQYVHGEKQWVVLLTSNMHWAVQNFTFFSSTTKFENFTFARVGASSAVCMSFQIGLCAEKIRRECDATFSWQRLDSHNRILKEFPRSSKSYIDSDAEQPTANKDERLNNYIAS